MARLSGKGHAMGGLRATFDELRERFGCLGMLIALFLIGIGILAAGAFFGGWFGGADDGGPETLQIDGTPDPSAATGQVTSSASPADAGTATTTDGRRVRVGNLELEVLEVESPFDATQYSPVNTANTRIDLAVTANGDGGGYFTAYELVLADDTGAEHGASSCLDCPGDLTSLQVGEGETGEGSAYFELPEGRTPSELIYRSSAAGAEGSIPLR
jgi:hypothetical protein